MNIIIIKKFLMIDILMITFKYKREKIITQKVLIFYNKELKKWYKKI